jgi:hypothetical protein
MGGRLYSSDTRHHHCFNTKLIVRSWRQHVIDKESMGQHDLFSDPKPRQCNQ